MTGVRTSGGACGLIRWYARNLTWARMWSTDPERDLSARTRNKVLHGCRQLVPWGVGLSPATSATPILSCHHSVGHSRETAAVRREEGGDDVKSSWPLCPGLHTCYNGKDKGLLPSDRMLISKTLSQFGLQAATRLHEAGIASNRISAMMRWIRSRTLYTPPVKPWKLGVPKVGNRKELPRVKSITGAKS